MIVTFFLILLYNFMALLIATLPIGSLPAGISSSVSYIFNTAFSFSGFFPIQHIFNALLFVIGFETAILTFRFLNWITGIIRGR